MVWDSNFRNILRLIYRLKAKPKNYLVASHSKYLIIALQSEYLSLFQAASDNQTSLQNDHNSKLDKSKENRKDDNENTVGKLAS